MSRVITLTDTQIRKLTKEDYKRLTDSCSHTQQTWRAYIRTLYGRDVITGKLEPNKNDQTDAGHLRRESPKSNRIQKTQGAKSKN